MEKTIKLLVALLFISTITISAQKNEQSHKGKFTIAVMSDTQAYSGKGTKSQPDSKDPVKNDVFDSQTKWLADNHKSQNIIFVSHAGDVIDINNTDQWNVALNHLNRLHGKIPYGISLGNHDMESNGNSDLFQKYFPESRFLHFPWYGGSYKNNTNSYQLISSNNVDLLILHLECNAPDSVLAWADNILYKYNDRFAIIVTHMFLGPRESPVEPEDYFDKPKGVMNWSKTFGKAGNTPVDFWNKCFKKHKNINLIISGDQSRTNAMCQELIGENGNKVFALLSDYSSNDGGGLRLYSFYPYKNKIDVKTYNTSTGEMIKTTQIVTEPENHNFTIYLKIK